MKLWLQDKDMKMYSTPNKGKYAVVERLQGVVACTLIQFLWRSKFGTMWVQYQLGVTFL